MRALSALFVAATLCGACVDATDSFEAIHGAPPTAPVNWTNVVGATANGNDLTKTGAVGWNAGAFSAQSLPGDGYLEVVLGADPGYAMVGLSSDDPDQDWATIEYALYTYPPTGQLLVFENGTYRTALGAYATGDVLRVTVSGTSVVYSVDGVDLYTSPTAPTLPLYADASMYSTGANVLDAVFLGAEENHDITWGNVVGATPTGATLTKTAAAGWGNAGGSSTFGLATGDFGYAEFTVPSDPGYAMFGLGVGDTSQSYEDIDFSLYTYPPTGQVLVFENGAYRATIGSYAQGDVLRVQVETDVVSYWKNGALAYTSAVAPTFPLRVDAALYSTGAVVQDAQLVGDLVDLAIPLTPEAVAWQNASGVDATGNDLTKTATTGWGNAGASSTRGLATGAAGYAEFTLSANPGFAMFGLGSGDANASYDDIEYAFYTYPPSGEILVFEAGTYRGSFGAYAAGDALRVSVTENVVKYTRNGALLYTSGAAPTYPLRVDTALYSPGANVNDAMIAGDVVDLAAPSTEAVVWQAVTGADASGNDLTKTAGVGWGNGGASSTRGITAAADGYAEFTIPAGAGYAMFGLSNGDANASYDDIDYAFYTYPPTGQLLVYEGGNYRAALGAYTAGDIVRVSVSGGTVSYAVNGTVGYTSGTAATYPLRVDTALYTTGSGVLDAMISGILVDVP